MGKFVTEELQKLLGCIKQNERVVVPPMAGYDSGVHRLGDKYVVVSTDPCTGVPEEHFGWLLIHYAASDVALFGAKPEFCTINLLGPLGTEPRVFQKAMGQACSAADELGVAIVTGHTGTYSGLSKLVGVCTAYGTVEPQKLITPGNAKPGDCILCTKSAGLETLVNFSATHKTLAQKLFGKEQAKKLSELIYMQSCVKDALGLAELSGVHAMHDATEGGFVAALNELAQASKLGFRVEYEKIPISSQMQKLQKRFHLSDEQVLAASSTGTILAAVDPQAKGEAKQKLAANGVSVSFIGTFTKTRSHVLTKKGKETTFPKASDDPYAMILSGKV